MAGSWRFTQHPRFSFIICVSAVLILLLVSQALICRQQEDRHRRDFADSTEIPAEHIDPAAIDLTPLVNTLINSSHSGSRQLFSLLSVTSYSSLALHKLTLLVYNISSVGSIESSVFRRRFCYCVTNETNDLTDFTAILLDVMGNSTSYLHELFKSSSILSVSQRNNSDCIYICVMAGKMGREVPELWDVGSITPLFNQTIVEGPHTANISFRLPVEWHQLPTNLSHISPSGMSSMLTSRVHSTAHGCPWRRPELSAESVPGAATTVGAHKLQPCVLELCKFFSQCLCRPFSHKTRMKRYCDDSHLWYEKHTSEVCRRVRRVSFSRNLKQRCLTKMCNKL
ncbi:HERV-H LTR-associating protein 1 isoform X3 [Maylandia zebra]|uniref:HERV-H LTR-associating protein 1 isoform X3 n=1 Tax=Maylandia zebra TaxID=106582 RepID=UPI00403D2697